MSRMAQGMKVMCPDTGRIVTAAPGPEGKLIPTSDPYFQSFRPHSRPPTAQEKETPSRRSREYLHPTGREGEKPEEEESETDRGGRSVPTNVPAEGSTTAITPSPAKRQNREAEQPEAEGSAGERRSSQLGSMVPAKHPATTSPTAATPSPAKRQRDSGTPVVREELGAHALGSEGEGEGSTSGQSYDPDVMGSPEAQDPHFRQSTPERGAVVRQPDPREQDADNADAQGHRQPRDREDSGDDKPPETSPASSRARPSDGEPAC
jgi:hypothetical protein